MKIFYHSFYIMNSIVKNVQTTVKTHHMIAILGFVGWYLYKKFKRNEPVIKKMSKPKEAPHLVAYRELERIKLEKLWQKNMVKDYHSQLTELLQAEHR